MDVIQDALQLSPALNREQKMPPGISWGEQARNDEEKSSDVGALEDLIASCEGICTDLKEGFVSDIFLLNKTRQGRSSDSLGKSFPEASFGVAGTTLGLELEGLTIDEVVIGGPAYASAELECGDVITRVDGEEVTADTVRPALVGCDVLGSAVTLTVISAAKQVIFILGAVLTMTVS